MKWFNLKFALPFEMVFDGESADPPAEGTGSSEGDDNDPPPSPPPTKKEKVQFTPAQQAYVNSLLAEDKRKLTQRNQELITQLETEKNRASTTAAERQALEERIETLKSDFQTKEQLQAAASTKRTKELETSLKKSEETAKTWQDRHHKALLNTSLTEAAVKGKAYNPKQVVTILKPMSRVVEILDEKGVGTGEFETKVKISTKDKEGKPVVLDLDPIQAVKQLAEMGEEYDNLFISPATGGLGASTRGGGTNSAIDRSKLSTEEYIRQRKLDKTGGRSK